ncbi:MAG: type II toxin-antitoxin system MqsA family antitoxin [Chloroflexi bacterium]|nr:type II toxin-antitoxin system MqsA family antitoxin [Chloroflexota bacterium]MCH8309394.1 type II toxin-antitoxin system MqsA family antitoxin [Chloroflexota bacterium]
MKCVICKHGNTVAETVTVTLNRGKSTFVFKRVPAQVCDNCGEEYLGEEVSTSLLELAEEAVNSGVEIEVREYVAA